MPDLLTRFPIHREVLMWSLLVLSFRLSAKLRKVESKTKEFIHFFAETEYLRHFHGKDNKKESFHKTIP